MKAVILAAGYATRLYPLTKDRPKALLPIAGKPMLDYIVEEICTISAVDKIFIVSNSRFYKNFLDWANLSEYKIPIKVLDDGTTDDSNKKGAIGDIDYVIDAEAIDDETLVMVGDNLFTFKLLDYYNFYKEKDGDCVCAKQADDIDDLRRFAVAEVDGKGQILNLIEKPENPPSNLAVFGTYFYKKDTVPLIKQYLSEGNKPDAPGYFPEWLYKKKPVYVFKMNGECFDIGTPEMYEEVNRLFKDGLYKN